ncbi:flavoprotein [Planctomycetota bacterium]
MKQAKTNFGNLKILLCVTAGIAAYKVVDLAAKLTGLGACVKTAMTENACELIGPKSFEAVTNSAVFTSLWTHPDGYNICHINLRDWADIVIVAPATANIIAKFANGICDCLVSTILCASWQKPILIAPAMNNDMWENPAVQKNIETVKQMGADLIGPEHGRLACGTQGTGRMAEPGTITEAIERIAKGLKTGN